MKQTAVVKELRFVQMPTENCFYAIPSVANLPFGTYIPILEQMKAIGEEADLSSLGHISDDIPKSEELAWEMEDTAPLLALVGTLECDVRKVKKQFKHSVRPTTRVVTGAYEDDPDPVIALLGTLECDVTDIGERHDDYIGDALLAELWGDEDE